MSRKSSAPDAFSTPICCTRNEYFLAAICGGDKFGLALVDLTTGDFKVTELLSAEQLHNELTRTRPAEIIVPVEWFDEAKSLLAQLALADHAA